jgi:hypothetical protein
VTEDLEVVVQVDRLPTAGDNPLVPGDLLAPVEHDDLGCPKRDSHSAADQSGGDGVLRHPHCEQRRSVHPGVEHQYRVEPFERQRPKGWLLVGVVLTDGADPGVDAPSIVAVVPFA